MYIFSINCLRLLFFAVVIVASSSNESLCAEERRSLEDEILGDILEFIDRTKEKFLLPVAHSSDLLPESIPPHMEGVEKRTEEALALPISFSPDIPGVGKRKSPDQLDRLPKHARTAIGSNLQTALSSLYPGIDLTPFTGALTKYSKQHSEVSTDVWQELVQKLKEPGFGRGSVIKFMKEKGCDVTHSNSKLFCRDLKAILKYLEKEQSRKEDASFHKAMIGHCPDAPKGLIAIIKVPDILASLSEDTWTAIIEVFRNETRVGREWLAEYLSLQLEGEIITESKVRNLTARIKEIIREYPNPKSTESKKSSLSST